MMSAACQLATCLLAEEIDLKQLSVLAKDVY